MLLRLVTGGLLCTALAGTAGCATDADHARANVDTFKKEGHDADRLLNLGRGFASVGDLTRAEEYFVAAYDAGAKPDLVMPLLLRVCVEDGKYQAAIHYAEDHLKKHPADYHSRFVLATLYSAVGEPEPARSNLEQVLETAPEDAEAHFALGVLMRESFGDPLSADRHFREYLRLDPSGQHAEEAQASLLKSVP